MGTAGHPPLNASGDAEGGAVQWSGWLQALHPPDPARANAADIEAWLARVQSQLQRRREGYAEAVGDLDRAWQALLHSEQVPTPQALAQVVSGLRSSVEHLGAADAMLALLSLFGGLVAALGVTSVELPPHPVDLVQQTTGAISAADALGLLASVSADRNRLTSLAAGDLLDVLAKVVLALEDAERDIAADPSITHAAFEELHRHIVRSADQLRHLFQPVSLAHSRQGLTIAIRECIKSVRGIAVELDLRGPEVATLENTEALVWTLQELLHHIRSATAERVTVVVQGDANGSTTLIASAGPRAFSAESGEPSWLLRSRVRMAVVGGSVVLKSGKAASSVEIRVG